MRVCSLFHESCVSLTIVGAIIAGGCNGGSDSSGGSGSNSGAGGNNGANASGGQSAVSEVSADAKAARDFVQGKIDACWVKAADGWTTQCRKFDVFGEPMEGVPDVLFEQYRALNFTLRQENLTESQKLNGTTYRAGVNFAHAPTRNFRTVTTIDGPPGWSEWREDVPAVSLAVELRNGKWLISAADMFSGLKPNPNTIPAST